MQNGGRYYVFSSGPQVDVTKVLMSRIPELTARTGITLAVPNNATAHIRGSRVIVLILAAWNNEDPNKLDEVRSATTELRRILLQGERTIPESLNTGYGNYGER